MAHVRTYSPSVRVGNWNEEVTLEEDMLKDFQERKSRGELSVQKSVYLKQNILRQIDLSVSQGNCLCFGDIVMLVNVGGSGRDSSAISINAEVSNFGAGPNPVIEGPCGISAGRSLKSCTRVAFVITSVDGSAEGEALRYDQCFALRTTSGFAGGLFLSSDCKTFQKSAKKSRLQEVNLENQCSFLSWWKIAHFDPLERMENEGLPVPANTNVLITHFKTNQALAVLGEHVLWSTYGKEYEVAAQTLYDSHKAERDVNLWMLVTSDPAEGGTTMLEHTQTRATPVDPVHADTDSQ